MPDIQLITLDLDNTLWDVDDIIIQAEQDLKQWLAQHVPDALAIYASDQLLDIRQDVFTTHDNRSHDLSFMRIQILIEVMSRAGFSVSQAEEHAHAAFDVFFKARNRVELFPGAEAMLAHISQRYSLIALTNGNADIHIAGIGDYFHGAYSSATVGEKKPHLDMFQAPLAKFGFKPSQAIHVGDNLVDDVHGANQAGMHSIWVNFDREHAHDPDIQPTRIAHDLDAVIHAINEIAGH